jgi:type IV pilus biogenesis protein CpaD/CtpE
MLKRTNFLKMLSIALCVILAGCAQTKIVDHGCLWSDYITAHPDDTLETKKQILSYDLTRRARCK